MKYKKLIALELERYPRSCDECPAFHTSWYRCHNEHGIEGQCNLGYMDNDDMRDFNGGVLYHNCGIKGDPRVRIMEEE